MTKISLRVYNREIEGMIESGQVEEAIAHCQNILKTFPMHLETYRLFGKAFLETRRYSDAADIFQRVLMSVPEDFVSHVGMSIIRDDESKLDEAIWHMERAFEVQPSNPAIQDELRKLYGRRDGVQPPKVRLTRDALANMYTQGALYSQAIAEIRAVLADDPNRPDLLVMLARAYSKDGRKKQAIEICTELLKKFPYCFDALRILIDLLPPSDQQEFTQTYRLRIRALDPYAGFVTGSIFNSDSVPDAAVNLELLDYDPNDLDHGSQPVWASSLGIKLDPDGSEPDVPDWLTEKSSETQPELKEENLSQVLDGVAEITSDVKEVPDWMRSSGWEKSSEQSLGNAFLEVSELEDDEPIAKAEIPEWLKDMAPEDDATDFENLPVGFESMEGRKSTNSDLEENHFADKQESDIIENVVSEEKLPDWLKDNENNEPGQPDRPVNEEFMNMDSDQDVFKTVSSDGVLEEIEKIPAEQPVDELPSWIRNVQQETVADPHELNEIRDDLEDLPDWLKEINPENLKGDKTTVSENIAESQGQFEEISSHTFPDDPDQGATESDGLPDWLNEINSEKQNGDNNSINETIVELPGQHEDISAIANPDDLELVVTQADELPDWLNDIESFQEVSSTEKEHAATLGIGSVPSYSENEEITPDNEMVSEPEISTPDHELAPEPERLGLDGEIQISISEDLTLKKEPAHMELPSEDDQDAGMAWLESLAARQGAKPEELLTTPGERPEVPPEWVKNSIEGETKPLINDFSMPSASELFESSEVDQKLSALKGDIDEPSFLGMGEQPHIIETYDLGTPFEDKVFEINDLAGIPETTSKEEPELSSEFHNVTEPQIESSPETDVPKWLKEMNANDAADTEDPKAPIAAEFYGRETPAPLPDWLKEIEASSSDWISGSEDLTEQKTKSDVSDLTSEEKDIDDIGEIFPTDTSNLTYVGSESEPISEPIAEVVKPVTSNEWHSVQPEDGIPVEELSENPITLATSPGDDLYTDDKPGGTGLSSKIPANEIEKEDGTLERAQAFIESGDIKQAIDVFDKLIKKGQLLEEVIHDLRESTYRFPVEIGIWQLLGDAYLRANRLQDALDAYTKAEELLR